MWQGMVQDVVNLIGIVLNYKLCMYNRYIFVFYITLDIKLQCVPKDES